jgi:hypothetical protein
MCADNMQRGALPLDHIVGSHDKVKASRALKVSKLFLLL